MVKALLFRQKEAFVLLPVPDAKGDGGNAQVCHFFQDAFQTGDGQTDFYYGNSFQAHAFQYVAGPIQSYPGIFFVQRHLGHINPLGIFQNRCGQLTGGIHVFQRETRFIQRIKAKIKPRKAGGQMRFCFI